MEFAKWFFWIHSCEEGQKVSRYKNLKQVEKTCVKMGLPAPEALRNAPVLDDACVNAWETFGKLTAVTFVEIKAMIDVTGNELEPWEIDAIIGLNRLRSSPESWTE